jgi:hypothetical protein
VALANIYRLDKIANVYDSLSSLRSFLLRVSVKTQALTGHDAQQVEGWRVSQVESRIVADQAINANDMDKILSTVMVLDRSALFLRDK